MAAQPSPPSATKAPHPSADQRQTERLLLYQTPIWITAVAAVMLSGTLRQWSDTQYVLFSIAVAAPSILLPAFSSRPGPARPQQKWSHRYWVKLNVWVWIVVCFGTYFGTHYFFDLMGMRYLFNVRWNFQSDVVGQARGATREVPVFMYPLTHAYFMTYFTVLMVVERAAVRLLRVEGKVERGLVMLGLGYGLAFIETFCMASPLLEDLFVYADRGRMLRVGSLGYAAYFVVGLPMVKRIDGYGEIWMLDRVVVEGLATSMGILVLLEVWAKTMGSLV